MEIFKMDKPVMTLTQFLKVNDYVASGGQAKYFLNDFTVKINDIECTLRGKKLYPNDLVLVGNDLYKLEYDKK